MSAPRMLRVRCATWEQLEAFYRRKLRRSGRLSMKVPFACEVGTPVTLALELPNQIVVAIDGTVSSVTPPPAGAGAGDGDGGRTSIDVSLYGLTAELLARLEEMVADARATLAAADDGDDEERRLLAAREAELRRQRQLAAHEIIGVPRDPSAVELRAAWLAAARREHPDGVVRFGSPALAAVAEETMILVARAYERMRAALVAAGSGVAVGPAVRPPASWSLADDPLASGFFAEALTPPVEDGVELVDASLSHKLPSAEQLATMAEGAAARAASGRVGAPPPAAGDDGGVTPSTLDELLPPVVTPLPAPSSVGVRWTGPGDLFADLDLGPVAGGEAPIAVEDSLAQGRSGPGDRFLRQIRSRLAAGDHGGAREVAEAALHVYGGDRRLRGLHHVAVAMAACARDDRGAALAALEAALAHDPSCLEAATALEQLRRSVAPAAAVIQRLFS